MIQKKTLTEPINLFATLLRSLFIFLNNRFWSFRFIHSILPFLFLLLTPFSIAQADAMKVKEVSSDFYHQLRPTTFSLSGSAEGVTKLIYEPTAHTFFTKVFKLTDRAGKTLFRAYENVFNWESIIRLFRVDGEKIETYVGAIKEYASENTGQRKFRVLNEVDDVMAKGKLKMKGSKIGSIKFTWDRNEVAEVLSTTDNPSVYEWNIHIGGKNISPLLVASLLAFDRHRTHRRNQIVAGSIGVLALALTLTHRRWLPYLKKYLSKTRPGTPDRDLKPHEMPGPRRLPPPPRRRGGVMNSPQIQSETPRTPFTDSRSPSLLSGSRGGSASSGKNNLQVPGSPFESITPMSLGRSANQSLSPLPPQVKSWRFEDRPGVDNPDGSGNRQLLRIMRFVGDSPGESPPATREDQPRTAGAIDVSESAEVPEFLEQQEADLLEE